MKYRGKRTLRESTGPMMLKFGLEIDFGVIQKIDAAIFEILIFRDFSGGQSPNFGPSRPFLDFDPLKNRRKIKILKIAASLFCITPKSISSPNFSINGPVDSRNNSILCQN